MPIVFASGDDDVANFLRVDGHSAVFVHRQGLEAIDCFNELSLLILLSLCPFVREEPLSDLS